MKSARIPLTQGKFAIVDISDLEILSEFKWCYDGRYAASDAGRLGGKFRMHRFLMKPPPGIEIDHINQDSLDNRRCNLRFCTKAQNAMNKPKSKRNTTGFKGVCFNKALKKFQANIKADGKLRHLGLFQTAKIASEYKTAAKALHGEFYSY